MTLQLEKIVREFPVQMQTPIHHLVQWIRAEQGATREDFSELKRIIQGLAIAQARTEQRVRELAEAQARTEQRVHELAEAQARTEQRVHELAEAQARTEQRVQELAEAQARTEERLTRLEATVEKLVIGQQNLVAGQQNLVAGQQDLVAGQQNLVAWLQDLEKRMASGFKSLADQISALGSRWGIYNEGTFRATIQGLLGEMEGVEIQEGYYGGRQVDVIIRDGEHIILEITSRMHPKDIRKLYQAADDYCAQKGIEPKLMVATSYISPRLMQKVMGLARPIEIFSYEANEE